MTRNLHGAFLVSREIYPNPVTECYGARNRRTKNQVASDGKLSQNGCQIFEAVDKNRPHKVNLTLSKNVNLNVTVTLKPLPQRYFVRLFQRDGKLILKYLCDPFKNKKQMGSPKQLFYHAVLNYPEKIKISDLNRIILLKLYYNKKTNQTFYF
jgi:hypothetical protein